MPGIFTTFDPELEAIAHTGWGHMPWDKIPANWRELPEPNQAYVAGKRTRVVRSLEFRRARQVHYQRAFRRRRSGQNG